jgi:tRNA (mo5U34)-methyltransferase
MAVIETSAIVVRGLEDHALCEFFASDQLNADPTNWWAPTLKGLHDLCRAAGFARVETVAGPPEEAAFADTAVFRYRAVVHAHK